MPPSLFRCSSSFMVVSAQYSTQQQSLPLFASYSHPIRAAAIFLNMLARLASLYVPIVMAGSCQGWFQSELIQHWLSQFANTIRLCLSHGVPYLYIPSCQWNLLLVNSYQLNSVYVLLNQYKFRILRFFPGPKNCTKWGPLVLIHYNIS